jgi:hypothetical protein
MHLTSEQRQIITGWAEDLPKVTAVSLLDSQSNRPYIELGLAMGDVDSWRDLLTFLNHRRAWRKKLEKLLRLRVHLQLLNHEPSPDSFPQPGAPISLWRRR